MTYGDDTKTRSKIDAGGLTVAELAVVSALSCVGTATLAVWEQRIEAAYALPRWRWLERCRLRRDERLLFDLFQALAKIERAQQEASRG